MQKQIIKKGYYIVRANDLVIMDGPFKDADVAEARWKEISHGAPGNSKFFILWNPFDNFAWGEFKPCDPGTHFDPDSGTCVPDDGP